MPKKAQPLTRKGDKNQKTKRGLEIPVPEREGFFGGLRRAARPERDEDSSRPDRESQ